ncbi:hypothetical protein AB6A40_008929, partial [Gnathostoma spinigerum]
MSGFSLALIIVVLIMMYVIHQMYWRRRNYPPGPTPVPFIGNFHQIDLAYPHRTLKKWRAKYGPIFTIWMPKPIVVLADFSILKEALVKQGDKFSGRPMSYLYGIFTHHKPDGDGIILAQNEKWRYQRRFALRVFRDFGMGKNIMETKIHYHTARLIKHIQRTIHKEAIDVMNVHLPLAFCVGNIIQDLVIGKNYEFGDENFLRFKRMIDSTLCDVASVSMLMIDTYPWIRWFLPTYYRYYRNGFALQRFFLTEIDEHEKHLTVEGEEPSDFIDAYIREMRRNSTTFHYNKVSLALNAGDLWTGGMETTVTTLRWAIIYLIRNKNVQDKLSQEIEKQIGSRAIRWSDRTEMPYTMAVLSEVQRVINILPWNIPHATTGNAELAGYVIKIGTTIMPQFGVVHLDDTLFPDPETFNPNRFLNTDGSLKVLEHFNPFGIGKRSCLGESLARMELFLILTSLVQNFKFSAA